MEGPGVGTLERDHRTEWEVQVWPQGGAAHASNVSLLDAMQGRVFAAVGRPGVARPPREVTWQLQAARGLFLPSTPLRSVLFCSGVLFWCSAVPFRYSVLISTGEPSPIGVEERNPPLPRQRAGA